MTDTTRHRTSSPRRACRRTTLRVAVVLWAMLAPVLAGAQVVVDAVSSANSKNDTLTWSHTVGAGTERALVVGIAINKKNVVVSSVTFGAQSLTLLGASTTDNNKIRAEMWVLMAPASGTADIVVTLSKKGKMATGAISFTGVDQSAGFGGFSSSTGKSSTPSVSSVAAASGDLVVDLLATKGDADSATPSSPQDLSWTENTGNGGKEARGAMSAKSAAGTGETMEYTLGDGKDWAMGGVAVKPAAVTRAAIDSVEAWRSAVLGGVVEWRTRSEYSTLGFQLFRLDADSGDFVPVTDRIVPALQHARRGGHYRVLDRHAQLGQTHRYRLVEIELDGRRNVHGPFDVTVAAAPGDDAPSATGLPSGSSRAALLGPSPAPAVDAGAGIVADAVESGLAQVPDHVAATPGAVSAEAAAGELEAGDAVTTRLLTLGFERSDVAPAPGAEQRAEAARAARAKVRQIRRAERGPRVRIGIRGSGWQTLEAARLAAALGRDLHEVRSALRDGAFSLTRHGRAWAYEVSAEGASMHFVAPRFASPYSDEDVFWLELGPGTRVEDAPAAPSGAAALEWSGASARAEGNRFTLTHLFDDPDDDYWMWDFRVEGLALPGMLSAFPMHLPGSAGSGVAHLTVRLHGASNARHRALVSINGEPLGEMAWEGPLPRVATFELPASLLIDGENAIAVDGLASADPAVPSVFYVNDLAMRYPRAHRADAGAIEIDTSAPADVAVRGLDAASAAVYDVTRPWAPLRLRDVRVEGAPDSARVTFRSGAGPRRYLAVDASASHAPDSVVADAGSDLRARSNRAEWLLITRADMVDAAERLAGHRRAQGLRAMVVDVQDVYDEFNHGVESPEAIWAFLRHAHRHWDAPPAYVVLGGEGSVDYRDDLGFGDSVIPTLLAPTPYGLFASDNLLADVEGNDGVAEMAIGRLPVVDASELEAVVDKLMGHDASRGAWTRRVVLAADFADRAGDFATGSDALGDIVSADAARTVEPVYADALGARDARALTLEALGAGIGYLNFIGHAGTTGLGNARLLDVADVAGLGNGRTLPVLTAFTCLAGQFGFQGFDGLGETLLITPDAGAVAVWSPSGLSLNGRAQVLAEGFHGAVFTGGAVRLGDAIRDAQELYAGLGEAPWLLDIYNLLGDPATPLK